MIMKCELPYQGRPMSANQEKVEPNLSMPECLGARKQAVAEAFARVAGWACGEMQMTLIQSR
jgi:hypothetical protein